MNAAPQAGPSAPAAPSAPTPPPAAKVPPSPPAPPTPAQLAEAKKFWEAGQKLVREKLYREALASFLEAYRIAPRESTMNDLGSCYRSLQENAAAYAVYEELLSRFGTTMKAARKSEVERALEELTVLTGLVVVKTAEPGAKVSLDGREVGVTPLAAPIRINLGPHTLTITKEGFDTVTRQLTAIGHDNLEVADVLQKEVTTGHVAVTAPPSDPTTHLFVDGKDVGTLPWQGDLDPGPHAFEAHSATQGAPEKKIAVVRREKYDVFLDVKPLTGTLTVTSAPPDAEIRVDKAVVGHGAWEGALPIGTHTLSVSMPGFVPFAEAIVLHRDEHLTQAVPGLVAVAATPAKGDAAKDKEKEKPHAKGDDYWGSYRHIDFYANFPTQPPANDVSNGSVLSPGSSVNEKGAAGGGLAMNWGYMLGWVGFEGGFTINMDRASFTAPFAANATDPQALRGPQLLPRTETYDIYHFGAAAIGGMRFATETQTARFTLGVHGGVGVKTGLWHMATNVDASFTSNPASPYIVPVFMLDTGVEFGGTPGTRFFIGAMMTVEHADASQTSASAALDAIGALSSGNLTTPSLKAPNVSIQHGTDVYIGPTLGFHFGN